MLDGSGGTAKTAALLGGAKVVPVQIQVVPQGQVIIIDWRFNMREKINSFPCIKRSNFMVQK